MTHENNDDQRILSVSYGSFSIKLQGFDDPFAIMKRVTEYFRVISARDATFGFKPLIEDTSILDKIDAAAFGDDVMFESSGSMLTLTPNDALFTPQEQAPELLIPEAQPMDNLMTFGETEEFGAAEEVSFELTTSAPEEIVLPTLEVAKAAFEVEHAETAAAVDTPAEITQVEAQAHVHIETTADTIVEHTAATLEAAIAEAMRKSMMATTAVVEPEVEVETAEVEETVEMAPEPETTPLVAEKPHRPLRIIRNDYAYNADEAEIDAPKQVTPKAANLSVNPFRKFPVQNDALSIEASFDDEFVVDEKIEMPEEKPTTSYRKLRV